MQAKSLYAVEMLDGYTVYTNQHPNEWENGEYPYVTVRTTNGMTVHMNPSLIVRIKVVAGRA